MANGNNKQVSTQEVSGHVTTEQTAKLFKAQILASGVLIAFGLVGIYFAFQSGSVPMMYVSQVVTVGGVAWLIVVKIIAWWNHG